MAKNSFLQSIQDASNALDKIYSQWDSIDKKIIEVSKEASKSFNVDLGSTKLKDVNEKLKESSTYREQMNAQMKETERLNKALTSAQAKFYSAQSSHNKDLIQTRTETSILNKQYKEQAILSSKLATQYQKQSVRLNQLRRSYKDLALKKEMGIALTKKEEKAFESLEVDIRKIDGALKKVDASTGQYQRNVGNYTSAIGGLKKVLFSLVGAFGVVEALRIGYTFAKETIEISRAAKGVEFAFDRLGAAGVDAFDRVKKSTRGLVSNLDIKTALVDFDNFNISLEQSDTLFEFLAVRAAQTGKSIDKLKDSLVEGLSKESKLRIDNLGISTADLNEELKKTPDFVQAIANIAKREVAEAGNILDEAANSSERWAVALENTKLQLGNLLTSGSFSVIGYFADKLEEIGNAFGFIESGLSRMKKGVSDVITPIKNFVAQFPVLEKFISSSAEAIGKFLSLLGMSGLTAFGLALNIIGASFSGVSSVVTQVRKDIVNLFDLFAKVGSIILNPIDSMKNIGMKGIKELASDIKNEFVSVGSNAANAFKKGYKDALAFTSEQVNEEIKEDETPDLTPAIQREKDYVAWVEKKNEALSGTVSFYEALKKNLQEQQKDLADTSKEYQDLARQIELVDTNIKIVSGTFNSVEALDLTPEEKLEIDSFLNTEGITKGMANLSNVLGTEQADLMGEFVSQYEWDYNEFVKFSEMKLKQAEDENTLKKEKLLDFMDYSADVLNEVGGLFQAISDAKIQKYDDEIAKNNETYDTLLANERVSEEQRDELEIEREKKNAILEEKKRKEQQKAAKIAKATAALTIAINTATAIIGALAPPPVGLGPVLGIPFSVSAGVMGAIQLATVLATPIPQYKDGRKGGKAELAMVGDGGVNEVITDASGKLKGITPNKPTYTFLDKGDSVLPNLGSYLDSVDMDSLNRASIMTSLNSQAKALSNRQMTAQFDKELSNRITSGIKEGFKGVKVSSNITNNNDSLLRALNFRNRRDV